PAQPRAVRRGHRRVSRSDRHCGAVRLPRRERMEGELGRLRDEGDTPRDADHRGDDPERAHRGAAAAHGVAADGAAAMRRRRGVHAADGQHGFALVAVLLVLAFVAVIGAEFAYSMRLEATAARVYKETLIATHLAEAGLEQAIRELVAEVAFVGLGDDKDADADTECPMVFYSRERLPIRRLPHRDLALGVGQFTYCISDEEARLNLNTAPPDR